MSVDWEHKPSPGRSGQFKAYGFAGLMLLVALGSILYVKIDPFGQDTANVRSVDGYEKLITDTRKAFGSSEVLETGLYDTYAMVEIPVEGSARRTIVYQYDGDFDNIFTKDQRDADETELIDLADVNIAKIVPLIASAPAEVGLPDGEVTSVSIRMDSADVPSVYIQVSTDFNESGSVRTDLAGEIVDIDRGDD